MKVRKAVIPAGGLGTRFLPASKSVPKELLPALDKPMILLAAEELAAAGIEDTIIVVSPGKPALESFFRADPALEQALEAASSPLARQVAAIPRLSRFTFVEQTEPLGLGHAVLTAADEVGDEPFVAVLPDDLVFHSRSATQQLLGVFEQFGGCVLAVEQVPTETISQYGIIAGTQVAEWVYLVDQLVEKPALADAPSNLGIVGRYVLTPQVFDALRRTPPGAKGEIQLTDGVALLMQEQPVYACLLQGTRHDGGSPLGLLKASLEIALGDPKSQEELRTFLDSLLGNK